MTMAQGFINRCSTFFQELRVQVVFSIVRAYGGSPGGRGALVRVVNSVIGLVKRPSVIHNIVEFYEICPFRWDTFRPLGSRTAFKS